MGSLGISASISPDLTGHSGSMSLLMHFLKSPLVRAFYIFDNLSRYAIRAYKYKYSSHHINFVGISGPCYDLRTTTLGPLGELFFFGGG
jgi:hypothetical protein